MTSSMERGGSRKAASTRPKKFGKVYAQPNPKPKVALRDIRRGELGRIMAARHGHGCDTDDAIIYLTEAAGLMQPDRLVKWAELRTPAIHPDVVWQVGVSGGPKRTGPDDVAKRLNLDMAERTNLGIRTIGACDVSRNDRTRMAAEKKVQTKREQRWAKGAKPRHLSDAALQPWALFDRSERWWHRQSDEAKNYMRNKALSEIGSNSAPCSLKESNRQGSKSCHPKRRKVTRLRESECLGAAAGQGSTISERALRGEGRFAVGEVCHSLPPPETTRAGGQGPPAPYRKTLTSPKVGSAILSKTYISLSPADVQPNLVGGADMDREFFPHPVAPSPDAGGTGDDDRSVMVETVDGLTPDPVRPAPAADVDVAEYDEVPDFAVCDAEIGAETHEPDDDDLLLQHELAWRTAVDFATVDREGDTPSTPSTHTDLSVSWARTDATHDDEALSEKKGAAMTLNDLHHAANELPPDRRTRLYRLLHRSDAETPEQLGMILDIAANKPNLDDRTALEQIASCGAHDDRGLPCPANRN